MGPGEPLELLSFRRTFTLLILLVVVPSAGLSGFGVLAIINERAAVEKRLEGVWTGRLSQISARLTTSLESANVQRGPRGLQLQTRSGMPLSGSRSVLAARRLSGADPRPEAGAAPLATAAPGLPQPTGFFSVATPQRTYLVAAPKNDDQVVGASIAPRALEQLVTEASHDV